MCPCGCLSQSLTYFWKQPCPFISAKEISSGGTAAGGKERGSAGPTINKCTDTQNQRGHNSEESDLLINDFQSNLFVMADTSADWYLPTKRQIKRGWGCPHAGLQNWGLCWRPWAWLPGRQHYNQALLGFGTPISKPVIWMKGLILLNIYY